MIRISVMVGLLNDRNISNRKMRLSLCVAENPTLTLNYKHKIQVMGTVVCIMGGSTYNLTVTSNCSEWASLGSLASGLVVCGWQHFVFCFCRAMGQTPS